MGRQSTQRRATLVAALLAVLLVVPMDAFLRALEVDMTDSALQRALRLARFPASDADRLRFHRRYMFQAGGAVHNGVRLDSIEVITEFRRTELIAEEHARINDLFGRSSLGEVRRALEPWHGKVYAAAHVGLSGTAIAVPPIAIALDSLQSIGTQQVQNIYSENAIVGAVIETPFDARSVGQSVRTITVRTAGAFLGQARVDFRALD